MPSAVEESPPSLLPSVPEGLLLATDAGGALYFSQTHWHL